MRIAGQMALIATLVGAAGVLFFYLNLIFEDLPRYGGDEGAYLIQAIYTRAVAEHPELVPYLPAVTNSVHLAVIDLVNVLTQHALPWLRVLGAAAYFMGIWFTFKAVDLPRERAGWFLLLGLCFPYYRFIFTALPEGWYVGVLGLMILLTARFYRSRPVGHAFTLGVLTAGLVLIKPHGVMMVAAFPALVLLDVVSSRRGWATLAARLAAFGAGFLVVGNAVQMILGKAGLNPFLFFVGGFYRDVLVTRSVDAAPGLGLLAAATMIAAMAILAGPPITVALVAIGRRWRAQRSDPDFQLSSRDLTFLLTLLALLATLAMVVAFTMKVAAFGESETKRLWGRYFEFFTPLLWLTAAPFLIDASKARDRMLAVLAPLIGLGALLACFAQGVTLFPWDATALTAFFAPNPERQTYVTAFPYRLLASLVIVLAAAATLWRWRIERTWLAALVGLGLLSTHLDAAVVSRETLATDLQAAKIVTDTRPGPLVAIADDGNDGNAAFVSLGGRPRIVTLPAGAEITPATIASAATLVVIGQHRIAEGGWTPVLTGQRLSVFVRAPGVSSSEASQAEPGP